MAKKILSEAQVRRFAKLASIPAINEMYGKYKRDDEEGDEEEKMEEGYGSMPSMKRDDEDEKEKMEEAAGDYGSTSDPNTVPKGFVNEQEEEMLPDEAMPPVGDEPEMDDMDAEGELDLTDEEAQAIIDLGKKLEAAMPAGGEEMGMDMEPSMEMGEEPPEEDETEEIMEALKGINYIPEKKDIVEEVARRVAKRLLKAKRAEKQLKEALGSKKRTTRRKKK